MKQQSPSRAFHISLWVAQALLAALFLMAGATKLLTPMEALHNMMPWTADTPEALVRFIGTSELLGGLGLVLPALLRIKPALTPTAALALALVQVLATFFHLSRGENALIGMNLVLFAIALFIAWGRKNKIPIHAKGYPASALQ